jgi:hypothetical protein
MKPKAMHKVIARSTKKHHELPVEKGMPEVITSTHALPGKMQARRHTRG